MRILHFITSLRQGGAERLLVDFIKYSKHENPENEHFLLTLKNVVPLLDCIRDEIESHDQIPFALSFSKIYKIVLHIRAYVENNNIEIVHSHLALPIIISRLAFPQKKPLVFSYHNMAYCRESPSYSWKLSLLDRITYRSCNTFAIFVSSAVEKCVRDVIGYTAVGEYVPNFAGPTFSPSYSYEPSEKLRIVSVGSLSKVKNHSFLLKEMAKISSKSIEVDIYGDGPLKKDLNLLIKKYKVPVELKGNSEISSELLCKYDLFILPSLSEGMPVSLLEALVSGLPCMLSDLPQLRTVAKNAAIYFNPNESGELAFKLELLLKNKPLLKNMASLARVEGEKYKVEKYNSRVLQVYSMLCNE